MGTDFFSCRPPSFLVVKKKGDENLTEKVASILLKIEQQVAWGLALIATRAFCNCEKPYGFRAI